MKLIDYINKHKDDEVTVWDVDYDMETYFYHNDDPDEWDKAMNKIASILDIVEFREYGVIVNLSEVIERNINNGVLKDLFIKRNINPDIDDIMEDIENIFAGYVSEKWITKFANSLV